MKSQQKRKNAPSSSDDDEDSDVEKNFALLSRRGGEAPEEREHGGEEEDEEEEEAEEEEEDEEEEEEEAEEEEDDEMSEACDEDEGGSEMKEDIRKELSNMSFEDIMKLQNKVGTKVYNEVAYGSKKGPETSKTKRRVNKNRPMEISTRKPAPFLRQVVSVRKATLRDPRFDDLSGEYKPEIFEKTYKFIDDIRDREKEEVLKQLKKTKKSSQKEKLHFLLRRLENQERSRQNREQQRDRELQLKRTQRQRAGDGGRPFFLKKSEKKKLQLVEKYEELKKSGKLENFLMKKRKRNAGKDRRKLPAQPQQQKKKSG